MIKLLLDKQIFASSDARFCRGTHNIGLYVQWSLGGLEEPQGGPPQYMKKLQCLKMIFRPFGAYYAIFHNFFKKIFEPFPNTQFECFAKCFKPNSFWKSQEKLWTLPLQTSKFCFVGIFLFLRWSKNLLYHITSLLV